MIERTMNLSQPVERIAVFRALHLGDLLLTVPALRSLRAAYPQAEITLIGLPWATWFVQRFHRYVDHLVEFAGFPGILEVDYVAEQSEGAMAALRDTKYDLIVQLHGSGRQSNPYVESIATPGTRIAGYFDGDRPAYLSVAAPYPAHLPEVLRNLNLMRLLSCPDTGFELELPLLPNDQREVDELLAPVNSPMPMGMYRPVFGIHAGSRAPARRWPVERFAAVADRLAQQHDAMIVLTGGPGEEAIAAEVESRMRTPALNLAGKTSLGGLAAL